MKPFRNSQLYIDNEVNFYANLRRKQVIGSVEGAGSITVDEIVNADLRNLYTNDNPQWVEAWTKREELRQSHKKELQKIEDEVLTLSPELTVNHVE